MFCKVSVTVCPVFNGSSQSFNRDWGVFPRFQETAKRLYISNSSLLSVPSQAAFPPTRCPITFPFSLKSGEPDEPCSVVPISHPFPKPLLFPPINHVSISLYLYLSTPESSLHIFIMSPLG